MNVQPRMKHVQMIKFVTYLLPLCLTSSILRCDLGLEEITAHLPLPFLIPEGAKETLFTIF